MSPPDYATLYCLSKLPLALTGRFHRCAEGSAGTARISASREVTIDAVACRKTLVGATTLSRDRPGLPAERGDAATMKVLRFFMTYPGMAVVR